MFKLAFSRIIRAGQIVSALVACLLLLSACATREKIVDRYVYVDRPVPVPCDVTIPSAPKFAVDMVKKGDSLAYISDAYMIDRRQRIGYEKQLESALTACLARSDKGSESVPGKAVEKTKSAGE